MTAIGLTAVLVTLSPERAWDQTEAKRRVQRVLDIEKSGQPWDKIAWRGNVADAEAEAKRTGKPLFVYFYLKKSAGPAAAPC